MITYDLMLERQRLLGAEKFSVAANANETVSLRFHFDRSWRRFDSKAAVFRNAEMKYYIIEILENRAKVPWEVLTKEGFFEVSVIGYECEKVITSDKAEILVSESLLPEDYKTLSPSEELFNRFKRECIAQAYLDYEEEINLLEKTHKRELIVLNAKINEANERTQAAIDEKNAEIEELGVLHASEKNALLNQIDELNSTIEIYKEKAENWDMVDYAISRKSVATNTLWAGGNEEFKLPMLNTLSISAFSTNHFSPYLKEIGLDLTKVTTMASIFNAHKSIEKLRLKNAKNVSSFASLFDSCKTIKHIEIDNLRNCGTLSRFAHEASQLQTVTFGANMGAGNYERAFCNCILLKEINGVFDMSFATDVDYMFQNCTSLETVRFVESSIGLGIDFSTCVRLSRESMENIFNALYPDAGYTLSLSQYAFENNFTQEEQEEWITFVTETKGWVLSIN